MNEEIFSSVDLVSQCLIDQEKIDAFKAGLQKVITPDSIVLDIGTGSGILGLLAARLGAKKVYCLEFDPYIAEIAKSNINQNGFGEIMEVVNDDAKTHVYNQPEKFTVILMEMLSTGMVDEFQVQAINNLHKQNQISNTTVLIPAHQEAYVTLSEFDFHIDNFNMPMVRHLWKHNENRHLLKMCSTPLRLNDIDFSKNIEEFFSNSLSFAIEQDCKINSIYFTSKTKVDNFFIDDTNSLNAPVVIPLPREIKVKKGDVVNLKIEYYFGGSYKNFNITIL